MLRNYNFTESQIKAISGDSSTLFHASTVSISIGLKIVGIPIPFTTTGSHLTSKVHNSGYVIDGIDANFRCIWVAINFHFSSIFNTVVDHPL